MNTALSSKISLIIGLAIPVIMVCIIAAVIIIPSRSLNPKTDFIYVIGQYPSYEKFENDRLVIRSFSIANEHLTESTTTIPSPQNYYPYAKDAQAPRFFIHRTPTDTNEEISFEEAKKLTLSDDETSPDGFTVSYGSSSGGFFPFYYESSGNRATGYLSNGSASKKITLSSKANNAQFQFVGWIVE